MAQPEPATPEVSLRSLIESVYEQGLTAEEHVARAYAAASDEEKYAAAIDGLRDVVLRVTSEWGKSPRSGHKNKSGLLRALPTMPGGVLHATVRLNDGTALIVGDVTFDIAARLMAEYAQRANSAAAGARFWKAAHAAMSQAKATKLADLGEERVEALQKKWGYRV